MGKTAEWRATPGQPPRAAAAGQDRAALQQGTTGQLHIIPVKDTEWGAPAGICHCDLAGGFLSGTWARVAGLAKLQAQLEHPVTHCSAQERGHETMTNIPNHSSNWGGNGANMDVIITFGDYRQVHKNL